MGEATETFTPEAMGVGVERDLVRHVSLLYSPPFGTVHSEHQWVWFSTGLPSRHHNGVLRSPLNVDVSTIRRRVVGFQRLSVPMMWWFFTPGGGLEDGVDEALREQGLELESDRPGMGLDLAGLSEGEHVVERVMDLSTFEVWRSIVNRAFGPSAFDDTSRKAFLRFGFDEFAPFRHYVLKHEDAFVAALTLTPHGSFVGVSNVATLPQWRRRGLASRAITGALVDARRGGAKLAVLSADDDGAAVYSSLGFREVCRHLTYVLE